jgi:hypothetical protein
LGIAEFWVLHTNSSRPCSSKNFTVEHHYFGGRFLDDYDRWQRRDLSTRRFVYIWADGVYFRPRMAKEKQCVPVLLGADEWGHERTALLRASSPPFGIKPAKPKAA